MLPVHAGLTNWCIRVMAFGCVVGCVHAQASEDSLRSTDDLPGKALFASHCASCHERDVSGAPITSLLGQMSPTAIYNVLTKGAMQAQASRLSDQERRQIIRYLTGQEPAEMQRPGRMCERPSSWMDDVTAAVASTWGIDAENTRSISAERAGLTAQDLRRLQLRWVFVFPDSMGVRSQPTIVGSALFVGSQSGGVYAMDAHSGCVHWIFHAAGEIRGSLVYGRLLESGASRVPALFFGDGFANVYAVEAATGSLMWKVKVDDHPAARIVGTPVLFRNRLYVPVGSWGEEQAAASADYLCCTFRGSLVALDRATGDTVWKRYTIPTPAAARAGSTKTQLGPSGASIWSTPTLDERRNLIYFGTGDNFSDPPDGNSDAIFAIDASTGDVRWTRQVTPNDAYNDGCDRGEHLPTCPTQPGPDIDFTAPPILLRGINEKDMLMAGQKSGDVYALDPDTGSLLWHTRLSHDANPWSGGVWFGMSAQHAKLFVPAATMLVPTAPAPPAKSFEDSFLGSPVNGLYALDVSDGHLMWSTPAGEHCKKPICASVMMAPIAIPGAILAASLDGYVHAFDEQTGKSLWSFNAAQKLKSLNGEVARGGMIMGAGAIMVANGTVYVTSSSLKDSSVLLALSKAN